MNKKQKITTLESMSRSNDGKTTGIIDYKIRIVSTKERLPTENGTYLVLISFIGDQCGAEINDWIHGKYNKLNGWYLNVENRYVGGEEVPTIDKINVIAWQEIIN